MGSIFTGIDAPFALAVEYVAREKFDAQDMGDWLTDGELVRYSELKAQAVAKRTYQWLLGRYVAKCACRRWLKEQGMPVPDWKDIQVSNDPNGMPRLSISEVNKPLTLSIAHSGDQAVAAVAACGNPVGVDIECYTPRTNLRALAMRVCKEAEYQRWFVGLEENALLLRFTQLWLAKEATAKCTGNGLQWQPGVFEVVSLSESTAHVQHADSHYVVNYESDAGILSALAWQHA